MPNDVFAGDHTGESVLDTLVGEGKKFDNVEALAAGKLKSDEHITTIETENATIKAELEALKASAGDSQTVKDLIAAVTKPKPEGSEGDKPMSQEELQDVIRTVVSGEKTAETKAANRAKGNALVLGKTDGNVEAARALVAARAGQLGMDPAKLAELSEISPDAFAALLEVDSTASSGSPSSIPNVNADALNQNTVVSELDGFKTKAWFDNQRKTLGHVKFLNDTNIQRELTRSMNGLGERFNN
jgi:hypothetical protein